MVRSAKPLSGVALACVLVSSGIQAADTAEVNFTAQISDGPVMSSYRSHHSSLVSTKPLIFSPALPWRCYL